MFGVTLLKTLLFSNTAKKAGRATTTITLIVIAAVMVNKESERRHREQAQDIRDLDQRGREARAALSKSFESQMGLVVSIVTEARDTSKTTQQQLWLLTRELKAQRASTWLNRERHQSFSLFGPSPKGTRNGG